MRVIPFNLCLVGSLVVGAIWVVQLCIFSIMSDVKSEELWAGQCLPQNVEVADDLIRLKLLCNKETAYTRNHEIIVNWVEEGKNPNCRKLKLWNSDRIDWRCEDGSKK